MKARNLILGALTLIVTTTTGALAGDNVGKWSLGYHGIVTGDFVQGISGRIWKTDKLGFEGNVFIAGVSVDVDYERTDPGYYDYVNNVYVEGDTYTETESYDGSLIALSGKFLYATVVREHSRFYVGLDVVYGHASAEAEDFDDGVGMFVLSPLFGAEYTLSGIPELGFDWEIGYRNSFLSVEDVSLSLRAVSSAIGVHYYF